MELEIIEQCLDSLWQFAFFPTVQITTYAVIDMDTI